jgi:hypothetical protein
VLSLSISNCDPFSSVLFEGNDILQPNCHVMLESNNIENSTLALIPDVSYASSSVQHTWINLHTFVEYDTIDTMAMSQNTFTVSTMISIYLLILTILRVLRMNLSQ